MCVCMWVHVHVCVWKDKSRETIIATVILKDVHTQKSN